MQLSLLQKVLLPVKVYNLDRSGGARILKLLLFLVLFQLCCDRVSAQSITIKAKNASLETVLKQVGKQAGYEVFYRKDQITHSNPVTINFVKQDLKEVLTKIFAGQPLNYALTNKTIVVMPKRSSYEQPSYLNPVGTIDVKGRVVNTNGRPFPGITIEVDSTNTYSITDDDGKFNLSGIKPNATLKFIGMTIIPVVENVNGRHEITIVAQEKTTALQEVVVNKGYYSEKQLLTTGDAVTIKDSDILKTPSTNPILALEGRVPGLYIQQSSGLPGASPTVLLRGENSILNGRDPLYIVDGIPYNSSSLTVLSGYAAGGPGSALSTGVSPLATLNPNDISEITVLKDADATAIYGSRGANGVIIITTKKGKAGKTITDFNISSALSQYGKFETLLNTQQYLAMREEGLRNDGLAPNSYSDYDINGTWDKTRYTDWQKALLGNTAHINNYQGNISGGDENTQFVINGGYRTQSLVYDHSNGLGDKQGTIRANINHSSLNKKLNVTFDLNYVNDVNTMPLTDPTGSALSLPPDAPALYNADGSLNWQNGTFQNPLAVLLQTAKATTDNFLGNMGLRYKLSNSINFNVNVGYNKQQLDELTLEPGSAISPYNTYQQRQASVGHSTNKSWIAEPQLNYEHALFGGKISALVGGTLQQTNTNSNGFTAIGAPSDAVLQDLSSAPSGSLTALDPSYSDYKYEAVYGRLNYVWQSKYIINITARRDGSSRFGPGNRFGNFGAIGAAWVLSEESWAKGLTWLSLAKIRGSYGITGNDQIRNYSYFSYYNYNDFGYQGISTLSPTSLSNPDVHWEVNKKLEVGMDLGFLNNRVNATVNYFRNRTGNQLVYQSLPDIAGYSLIVENLPAVVQNTGVEGVLNTVNIKSAKFSWKSSFNITTVQNKLVSFPGLAQSGYASIFTVGQSLNSIKRLHFTGVDPLTGLYTFEDVNKDGVIDQNDKVASKPIGPQFFGGFNNSFNYKGFELDIFFQFVKQNQFSFQSGSSPGGEGNQPVAVLQRWQNPGDKAPIQRFTSAGYSTNAGPAYSNYEQSDGPIANASFIRLKNVNLNYTLPASVNNSLHVNSVRIFVTADNLLTFTPYIGPDPETAGTALPPLRSLLLGINVSL